MSYEILDGQYHTGLLVPVDKPRLYPTYRSQQRVLSRDQIRQIIENPDRSPARLRFPSRKFIRNQGGRGSCNGYAGAGALTRARVAAGLPYVQLSGEFLYSAIAKERDNGSELEDGMIAMQERGICEEALVPYENYKWSKVSDKAKQNAKNYKAFECYAVDDESEFCSGIALGFFGIVAVQASRQYQKLDSRGVRMPSNGKGNHAVGIQDVRTGPDGSFEYDEFGSWGLSNGQEGCAWLRWRDHLASTCQYHTFYLIRAASDYLVA